MLSYLMGSQEEKDIPPPPEWMARILSAVSVELAKRWLEKDMGLDPSAYRITSTYRDPANNARVGGARNSAHLHGLAVDVVITPATLRRRIVEAWPYGYAEDEGDHVHLNVSRRMGRMWARAGVMAAVGAALVAV